MPCSYLPDVGYAYTSVTRFLNHLGLSRTTWSKINPIIGMGVMVSNIPMITKNVRTFVFVFISSPRYSSFPSLCFQHYGRFPECFLYVKGLHSFVRNQHLVWLPNSTHSSGSPRSSENTGLHFLSANRGAVKKHRDRIEWEIWGCRYWLTHGVSYEKLTALKPARGECEIRIAQWMR